MIDVAEHTTTNPFPALRERLTAARWIKGRGAKDADFNPVSATDPSVAYWSLGAAMASLRLDYRVGNAVHLAFKRAQPGYWVWISAQKRTYADLINLIDRAETIYLAGVSS